MQPLRSRVRPASPIEAHAVALLRSIKRYEPCTKQKQRVRMRILKVSAPRHARPFWPALAIGLVLVAATASAAFGGLVFMKNPHPGASGEPSNGKLLVSSAWDRLVGADVAASSVPEAMWPTAAEDRFPLEIGEPTPESIDRPAREGATSRARPAALAPSTSEKVLVFEAMRALRRDGHPEQAAKLAAEYLRRNPQGTLAEEALAIAMEASTALRDPQGKNLADQYLASYPRGRFRAFAERVSTRNSP